MSFKVTHKLFSLVLFVLLTASPAFTLEHVQKNILVVKTKQAFGIYNDARLLKAFESSQAFKHVKSYQLSFDPKSRKIHSSYPWTQYLTFRLKDNSDIDTVFNQLKSLEGIEHVEPAYLLEDAGEFETTSAPLEDEITQEELAQLPNDPMLAKQWYLKRHRVFEAWEKATGKGIYVADVESGFDYEHPDLITNFDLNKSFDYDPETKDTSKVNDNKMTHGTPVCGLIAMEADNGLFGTGVAYDSRIIGSQMADTMKTHLDEKVWTLLTAKAILGSVEKGADVILVEKQLVTLNSSVERSKVIYDAIKTAVDAGIPVIVPAGNYRRELVEELELKDSGSIFVGGVGKTNWPTHGSNFGKRVNIAAAGDRVYSIQQNSGETIAFGGTSSAAAIVAGAVALIREANYSLSPREIRSLLMKSGKKIDGKRVGPLLQAGPAVEMALSSN